MRNQLIRLSLAIFIAPALFGIPQDACGADDPKASAGATVLADSGFRPKPAGFSFENWGGDQYPYSDLTANDAVLLFGEQVCAQWKGQECIPTPAAKVWLREMNQMMKGGHCEGMAALSAAFYAKQEKPSDYGAKQAFELSPKDQELMTSISAYFATQALEPVQSVTASTRDWPLQKIIDTIIASLKAGTDYPTLGIYGSNGGHAVTPYMVQQLADGSYRIFVYDNNYPASEKWIDVDPKKDVWVYAGAALNPKEDPAPWTGGSGAMDLTLLSTRYEPLTCPFCGGHKPPKAPAAQPAPRKPRKPAKSPDSYSVITPNRCSQIQATRKSDKKQISSGKKGKKNEIAGAQMTPLRGSRGCNVRLPSNAQYDISLIDDGLPLISAITDLFIFGAGNAYGVSNVALSPSTTQVFMIGSSRLSYQAGGSQKPTLIVASDRPGPNTYYEVSGFTLSDGFQFNAEVSGDGDVTFSDNDPDLDSFDVSGEVLDENSTKDLELVDLSAGDKGDVELDLEPDGDVDVDIDSDGDGTDDEKDADDDNDGTPDASDQDDDNDGVSDDSETEDEDHDGKSDDQDTDDDNDGTPDAQDTDDDNDGTPDSQEADTEDDADDDNDGTPDEQDADDDNDGTPDAQDTDDDNDGTPDSQEADTEDDADDDNDGTPDEQDTDDDNDGTPDEQDADDDNDGTADTEEASDEGDDTTQEEDNSGHDGQADDGNDAGDADDSSGQADDEGDQE